MNFLSRLLTTAGLAALLGTSVTTAPVIAASNPDPSRETTTRQVSAEQQVRAALAGVDFRDMSLVELRGVVDGLVRELIGRPDITPEYAASLLAQHLLQAMSANGPVTPSISETVQAVIVASVIDGFGAQGWPIDRARIVQAAAAGAAQTAAVGRVPTASSALDRDLATRDRSSDRHPY